MIEERLTPGQWLMIPQDIRNKLVQLFSIPRSGYMDVRNLEVVSDGYTFDDLKAITTDKLKEYTGLKVGSMYELLTAAIIKIQAPEVKQSNVNEQTTTSTQNKGTVSIGSEPKKRGRKKRQNN